MRVGAMVGAAAVSAAGLAWALMPAPGPEDGGHAKKPASHLEVLRALAGTWNGPDGDGDGAPDMTVTYKVTSAGHAVCETLFPGTDHEMITVYHADGTALIATHYCAAGNQPRMRCEHPDQAPLVFGFQDCTNRGKDASGKPEACMGGLKFTFKDRDRFLQEWSHEGGGEGKVVFEWTRAPAAGK